MTSPSSLDDQFSGQSVRAARRAYLEGSPLFDVEWYRERYPDLADLAIDVVEHFLDHGGVEERQPHPLFHTAYYLHQNPDVRESGLNPLVHFLEIGAAEGRNPNALFDTAWYVARYMRKTSYGVNPLTHYLRHPDNDTSPVFQSRWYRGHYMGWSDTGETPLGHYLRVGRAAGSLCNADHVPDPENAIYRVLEAGLFDATFYASASPDVAAAGVDPFTHYAMQGCREWRATHPLFDIGFYMARLPEGERTDVHPVVHYLDRGAALGLDPNPFFDTAWYRSHNPGCGGENPLVHFIRDGGRSTNPSPWFDVAWYLARHADVAQAEINPLQHYLQTGMGEGRATRPVRASGRSVSPVSDAKLVTLKNAARDGRRTVLMVTHAPRGALKGHVGRLVDGYRRAGASVVLIVAAGRRRTEVPLSVLDACSAVFVRENVGFDFAAWAHVLAVDGALLDEDLLVLTNDSLLGPLDEGALAAVFERVEQSVADVVGLTENTYYAAHIQSFFLALKRRCLSSYGFNQYMASVVNLATKDEVINTYELTLTARLRVGGLEQEVLFTVAEPGSKQALGNQMIFAWQAMLDQGLPFVKASLAVGEHRDLGGDEVRSALAARGFDLRELEATYRYPGPGVWADLDDPRRVGFVPRVAFFGPLNVANGLGVASRGYVKALHRTGWSLNVHPLERPFHVHARMAPSWQARSFSGPADVALVHLNGSSWDDLLTPEQWREVDRASLRVGLLVWETSHVPDSWMSTIDGLDAIWVPTAFCAEIFRRVTPVPVDVVPYVVESEPRAGVTVEAAMALCRTFGLDPDRRHILYAFDGSSFLARKNPQALIRAFRAAGLPRGGWQLVLKTKHVFDLPVEGQSLLDLVGKEGDVVVVDQPIARNELEALFALCPVYASSHASEGFGLTIAEAMERGKVVVATDYGGSRDFLDATCGFPVAAREVAIAEEHGPYLRGSLWGEVDENALADALRAAVRTVEDGSADRIGAAARARIGAYLSAAAVSAAMAASLDSLLEGRRG